MQLNCGYLTIELINYYAAVAARGLLQFSLDKLTNFYASCKQQDVQSFADNNLQHKLDLSN